MISLRFAPLFLLGFVHVAQQPTVTYTTVAVPLSRALAEISKQVHYPLTTGGAMAKQPIIVAVENAPANELLTRIAKVTFGTWRQVGDGYELTRNDGAMRLAHEARRKRLIQSYEKQIADRLAEARKQGALTLEKAESYLSATQKQEQSEEGSTAGGGGVGAKQTRGAEQHDPALDLLLPVARAIDEVLSAIGAEALADVAPGQRVVYSTNPNRLQRPLGDASLQIISEYQSSEKTWQEAVAQNPHEDSSPGFFGGTKDPGPINKIDVVLSRSADSLSISLEILDSSLRIGDQDEDELWDTSPDESAPESPSKQSAKGDEYKIPLSAESRWLMDVSTEAFTQGRTVPGQMDGASGPKKKAPEGLEQKLFQPNQYDPLGWVPSELLIGLARHKKLQLVAMMPDSSFMTSGPDISAEAVSEQLKADSSLDYSAKDGWIQAAPADPETAFRDRADRPDLARLLQQLRDPKASRLELFGEYFARHYAEDETLCSEYCSLVPIEGSAFTELKMRLAFYGSLPVSLREQLADARSLQLGLLPPEAQSVLQELVYNGRDCRLKVISPGSQGGRAFAVQGSYEPTELLPNGIPSQGSMTLQQTSSTLVKVEVPSGQPGSDGPAFYASYLRADSIAMMRAMKDDPRFKTVLQGRQNLDLHSFLLAHSSALNFGFQFTPAISTSFKLEEKHLIRKEPFTWDTLPEDFKKAVVDAETKAKDRLSKLPADFLSKVNQPRQGGTQNPPP